MQTSNTCVIQSLFTLTIRMIMNFTQKVYRDFRKGNKSVVYTREEFPLRNTLKDLIKDTIVQVEDSYLLQAYLTILSQPNRIDILIVAFMRTFINKVHNISDLNVMRWAIICCLISIVLYDNGFKEAPSIAVETVRGMCCVYHKYHAFINFGCLI